MQLGHVFTLANRSMKKPLLAAASAALSFGILLGSAPAVAETKFVEGIYDPEFVRFDFYDSELNDSSYFAALTTTQCINQNCNYIGYLLWTNISLNNPLVYKSDTNWEEYYYSYPNFSDNDPYNGRLYYLNEYRGGVRSKSVTISEAEYGYGYTRWTTDGGYYRNDDPIFVDTELSLAFSELPSFQGIGIFDFEQSFVRYGDGSSMLLADLMKMATTGYYGDTRDESWSFSLDTRNDSFAIGWIDHRITGITLAYNLPIPEPETWAMLLAGLGIVGAVTRRH